MYNPSINNENSKDEDLNKNDNMKNTTNYYVADIYIANINSLKHTLPKALMVLDILIHYLICQRKINLLYL